MRLSWGKASIDIKGPTNLQVRGALANLAPVAAGLMVVAGTLILWRGGWPDDTAAQRIEGISMLTIICALLMGLGMFYLWQLLVKKVSVQGPGGFSADVEVSEDSDQSEHGTAPTAADTMKILQENQ